MKSESHSQGDGRLSALFIVPSDYDSIVSKGVLFRIFELDESGFFQRVVTYLTEPARTADVVLNGRHRIVQYGPAFPLPLPKGGPLRWLLVRVNRVLRMPLFLTKLLGIARQERIDIVRATDPYWCGFLAWATSRLVGVPFCVSIHADYAKVYRLAGQNLPRLFGLLERFVLGRADLLMPISHYLARKAVQVNQECRARIRVIPHGIEPDRFLRPKDVHLRETFGIPDDRSVINIHGRVARDNYVYDALEVARRLRDRGDFVLVYVGDGPEMAPLQKRIEADGLQDCVQMIGFQPSETVASILGKASLGLCLLSGFVLIETCMSGVAPVCYDIEWHRELVTDGETGFLIEDGDVNGLTKKVSFLLDNPEIAAEVGGRAQRLALERHTLLESSERKKSCYRELLGRSVDTPSD